jgi:predicted dienelactone hydrolase
MTGTACGRSLVKAFVAASLVALVAFSAVAIAAPPPSQPGVDAPALAPLGQFSVGVRTFEFLQRDQPDVAATIAAGSTPTSRDRRLAVEVWYPATRPPGATADTYHGAVTGELRGPPVPFSVPGLAFRNAPAAGGKYALVVVSHGLGNDPVAMSWLTENLASKGYVVAAIHHEDPPYGDPAAFPASLLRRPLDIVFITDALQTALGAEGLIDPAQVVLIGYSMGGYGALVVAGAELDPAKAAQFVPGNLLAPYAQGGPRQGALRIHGLRAVIALAPAGGGTRQLFTPDSIAAIRVPLLLIVGDDDNTVGFAAVRSLFEAATSADRYLLTFHHAGHNIGLNSAPEEMRTRLWDLDWFEDPVWRKDRIIAINLHFITAFLDGGLKQDAEHRSYLAVPQPESTAGSWPAPGPAHWSDRSPGGDGNTVWKGFQNRHSAGLELLHRAAAAP